jgi:hypothetical protein
MCNGLTRTAGRRPRWLQLYGLVLVALGSAGLIEISTPRGAARVAASGALVVGACVITIAWIRANRVALDLLDWCDCAPTAVRVVGARTADVHPPGRMDDTHAVTLPRVPDAAGLCERLLEDLASRDRAL